MLYCNDLYTLSVLSLYEGELIGVVDKLYFDKNLKKLLQVEIVSNNGVKLVLKTKNIYKIGKNAITIKNNQLVEIKDDNANLVSCPINSKVYSINGEYLGVIKEISVNDKYLTQKISLDNNNVLDVGNIASCGKNTVIFNDGEKININKFLPQQSPKTIKMEKHTKTVEIQPILKEEKTEQPKVENIEFLIGRRCKKDILNFNNEVLIKANGLVNKKNLKEIKKYGKLRELMLFCK